MARYIDYAKIPMQKNDIGAKTIGEYFEKLLLTLWDEQEGFSGKRPFGNSGWEYDVYASLISAGVVDGSLDEEGYVANVTYSAANDIISEMIKQIFARGINAPAADVAPKSEVAREIFEEIEEALQYEIDLEDKYGRNAWAQGDVSGFQTHEYAEDKLETILLALSLFKKKYTEEKK